MKYTHSKSILERQAKVTDILNKWSVEEAYVTQPYTVLDDYVQYVLVMPQPKKWYNVWKELIKLYTFIEITATNNPMDQCLDNKMIIWKGGKWLV